MGHQTILQLIPRRVSTGLRLDRTIARTVLLFSTTAHKTHKKTIPDVPAITKVQSQKNQPCGGLDEHATPEMP